MGQCRWASSIGKRRPCPSAAGSGQAQPDAVFLGAARLGDALQRSITRRVGFEMSLTLGHEA